MTNYWKGQYDWTRAESKLNELPNYQATIDVDAFGSIDLHFVHQKSSGSNAIPLLFCHGWPGSYIEVSKILPKLLDPSARTSFHVVAPSLLNFGWSAGVTKRGFGLVQYAEICHKLMLSLGYTKYATQGGDLGFYISRIMGLRYPDHVLASHINLIRASQPSWSKHPLLALAHTTTPYTDYEVAGLKRSEWFTSEGSGYKAIQSTKPQTPGYAITDSPVALLAWIYEKLHDWTDSYPWTDDEVLTWVSIYWFSTAGPAASFRIYYEMTHQSASGQPYFHRQRAEEYIPSVKLGMCWAPREITVLPKTWGRTLGEIVYEKEHSHGGHFLAHENPDAIVGDLRDMFHAEGPISQVVKVLQIKD